MSQEFEGDLMESVFWGADLSRSTFRDVRLDGVSISHASLDGVTIDAFVNKLVINGVDVTEYVNAHDEWYPLRAMLTPSTSDEMLTAWNLLSTEWAKTLDIAASIGPTAASTQVDGQWSLIQTLRHLVFAMDKWFIVPVLKGDFSAIGLPNTGSMEFPWPNLDYTLDPTMEDVLAVWNDKATQYVNFISQVQQPALGKTATILENGDVPLLECVRVPLEEGFWHLRYVRRDLAVLAGG